VINSIGNLGGFAGPYLGGLVKGWTGSTDGVLLMLAATLVVGSVTALLVAHDKCPSADRRYGPAAWTAAGPPLGTPKPSG
jgi:nitrate/nitrite transporter NarK